MDKYINYVIAMRLLYERPAGIQKMQPIVIKCFISFNNRQRPRRPNRWHAACSSSIPKGDGTQ